MLELLIVSTAVGFVATFAAPWLELRGTYAAWRIVEWHTFWRGESSFQLASVIAANYHVPVEFATAAMQDTLRAVFALGSALGAWFSIVLVALLAAGARMRLRAGTTRRRVAAEVIVIVFVNLLVLYLLATLLALPSTLTPKVDFRTSADIHTDSLIWSGISVLPIAPALAVLSIVGQLVALWNWTRTNVDKRGN
ncbi:MAG TPA: hypothetical protein VF429_06550 [Anaerolineae bacterium]